MDDQITFYTHLGYGSLADVLDALEGLLDGTEHLAGDRFTAADLVLGSQLGWGVSFGTLEKRPAFAAYRERLAARPAPVRARALDDRLLAGQTAGQAGAGA